MFIASLLVAPFALSEVFFVSSYRFPDTIGKPKLSIESFIFSFAVGEIIAVIYEYLLSIKLNERR